MTSAVTVAMQMSRRPDVMMMVVVGLAMRVMAAMTRARFGRSRRCDDDD
jgi:uncharacterized membrane protein